MKKLPMPLVMALSPALVCVAAGITYLVLFRIQPEFAKIVASAILGSLVTVYKYLKDKEIKLHFLKAIEGGVNVQRFTLKWYLIIIYGSLVLIGISQFAGGVGGVLTALILGNPSGLNLTGAFIGIVINPVLFFLFGTWVGKKSDKHGILAIFITMLVVGIPDVLFLFLMPESFFQEFFNQAKGAALQQMFLMKPFYYLISVLIALLGYWRGRRRRLVAQLQDLFRVLPRDIQATIVDLVYEEATKISSEKVTPSPEA